MLGRNPHPPTLYTQPFGKELCLLDQTDPCSQPGPLVRSESELTACPPFFNFLASTMRRVIPQSQQVIHSKHRVWVQKYQGVLSWWTREQIWGSMVPCQPLTDARAVLLQAWRRG